MDSAALVKPTGYAWAVFAFVFALLISDYMARQVLAVGCLTFPLLLAADRYGRIASITAMALLWSAATVLCSLAGD